VTRFALRSPGAERRRWVVAAALGALVAAGCTVLRREPLDVPPGHQVVLGEILISGFVSAGVLEIVREDGTFRHELSVDRTTSPFVFTLPPGRYQITSLKILESGRTFRDETVFRVGAVFEVGKAAAYLGSIRIERSSFGHQVSILVQDDYEHVVPEMRVRYPELPPVVERSLLRPT
jgi:hypothetical protein